MTDSEYYQITREEAYQSFLWWYSQKAPDFRGLTRAQIQARMSLDALIRMGHNILTQPYYLDYCAPGWVEGYRRGI